MALAKFSPEVIDGLTNAVREALTGNEGETVTNIQLREMADGTGCWAVFSSTYDADGTEHDYRVVIDHQGFPEAVELN